MDGQSTAAAAAQRTIYALDAVAAADDVSPPARAASVRPSVDSSPSLRCRRAVRCTKPRPGWRRGVVASGVGRMNEVNARRARLVPGWVTVFGRV